MKAKVEPQPRERLLALLSRHRITNLELPEKIHENDIAADNEVFRQLTAVCQELAKAKPRSLLNLRNVRELLQVAQSPGFVDRARNFAATIAMVAREGYSLDQDIFHAICQAQLKSQNVRLEELAICLTVMKNRNLLSQENIKKLVDKFVTISPLADSAQQLSASSQLLGSYSFQPSVDDPAGALSQWLRSNREISQAEFDFMMRAKNISQVCEYMRRLAVFGLDTPENGQALVDMQSPYDPNANTTLYANQKELNDAVRTECGQKLSDLNSRIEFYAREQQTRTYAAIHRHALALYTKLNTLSETPAAQADPRELLHMLTVVSKALPTREGQKPEKADVEELVALGNVVKGHPSPEMQELGKIMMAVGFAVAALAGFVITFITLGVASPVGIGMAVAGSLGCANMLAGLGLFGVGKSRTGMSRDMVNLATEVEGLQPQGKAM